MLEGPHLFDAALAAGARIDEVFILEDDLRTRRLCEAADLAYVVTEPRVLDRLAPTEHPRGPVAVLKIPQPSRPARDAVWVGVADPGNAGTVVRTAAAFGLDVIFGSGSVDAWSPKVLRASAGAHFQTRICEGEPPEDWGSIATVVSGGADPSRFESLLDPARKWVVLLGSEAHGLDPGLTHDADVVVTIPMPGGIESLNAAVAASIVTYELARWRNGQSRHDPER